MAITKAEAAAQVMEHVCKHDAHGYSQPNRKGDGTTERLKLSDGSSVEIHGGDYDCSELVRQCWAAVGVLPKDSYMWTGNQDALLTKHGFTRMTYSKDKLKRGDVLWTASHTGMYLGDGLQGDAHIDESGGVKGRRKGDNTGHEIEIRALRNGWARIYRYNEPKTAQTAKEGANMGYLYGIDVSSNQPADICKKVPFDFAFVKMGGNPHGYAWNYINPYAKQQAADAYAKCGCVGFYWFCYGKLNANTEADLFVKSVKELGYLGKAVLVCDYEADALKKGRSWVKKFCERVKAKAGYAPVIYASGSVIEGQNLASLGYELWSANYSKGNTRINGYSTSGMKPYVPSAKIWQFTENGILKGYGGGLDLNKFNGTKADWAKLAGNGKATAATATTAKKVYTAYTVTAKSGLNFRKGAGTKYAITRTLANGATVQVEKITNGWAYTKQGDWCSASYIKKK